MNITWSNFDRGALHDWLGSDLGRKFLVYLEQQRPDFPDPGDLNAMAMAGAIAKGYGLAIKQIELMRYLEKPSLPPVNYIEVAKD